MNTGIRNGGHDAATCAICIANPILRLPGTSPQTLNVDRFVSAARECATSEDIKVKAAAERVLGVRA